MATETTMSIVVITTFTRPAIDTPFQPVFDDIESHLDYLKKTYVDTGKILSRTRNVSADLLTMTFTTIFPNDEQRQIYKEDPIPANKFQLVLDHCKNNNIKVEWKNQEIVEGNLIREWAGTFNE